MHFLSFQLKRANHRALHFGHILTKPFGLTPARFDLLYAIQKHKTFGTGMRQCDLREELGVSRATVSRMLKSLEELGLLRRAADTSDRRTKFIVLTEHGIARIRAAIRRIHGGGYMQLAYECSYNFGGEAGFFYIDNLYFSIQRISRHLGDRSTLHYPMDHPDD